MFKLIIYTILILIFLINFLIISFHACSTFWKEPVREVFTAVLTPVWFNMALDFELSGREYVFSTITESGIVGGLFLAVLITPLVAAVALGAFGFTVGIVYGPVISVLSLFSASVILAAASSHFFINHSAPANLSFKLATYRLHDNIIFDWIVSFNSLSIIMCLLINFISLMVNIYSLAYMRNDDGIIRFFAYLNLFTFFMLLLVSSGSALTLLFAWEGVGLISFLLVSFWWTRAAACKAGLKAIIINKLGDLFLTFFFILMFLKVHSFNFSNYSLAFYALEHNFEFFNLSISWIEVTIFFLISAAFVKSAQLFFHVWLPDAMEGPTPVSALLHSATMVIAGVFLILKFSWLFEAATVCKSIVWYMSLATVIFSGSVALAQNDLKKIIAYSTCSQIGFMFLACALSGYAAALFHLINHAFFKSLLFLASGVIIHNLNNEQDIRRMGGLKNFFPFTFALFVVATLSMLGLPFLAGYYSKDLIIGLVLEGFAESKKVGCFSLILFIASIALTNLYMIRLLYRVFFGELRISSYLLKTPLAENYVHQISFYAPMWILGILSCLSGWIIKTWFLFGPSSVTSLFEHGSAQFATAHSIFGLFCVTNYVTTAIFVLSVICFSSFVIISEKLGVIATSRIRFLKFFFVYFTKKGFFDEVYNIVLIGPFLRFCYNFASNFDKKILNFFFGERRLSLRINKFFRMIIYYYNNNNFSFQLKNSLFFTIFLLIFLIFLK